jgi:two-component system, LuxR family, sensor kinase FixL
MGSDRFRRFPAGSRAENASLRVCPQCLRYQLDWSGHPATGMSPHQSPFGADTDRLLAAIVDSTEDAIIRHDLTGTIVSWNRGAQTMFGYASSDMIGRSISHLLPRDDDGRFDSALRNLRGDTPVEPRDVVMLTKDGQRIQVSVSVSPIRDADGRANGGVMMARDLTAQRRAEQALRRSEERWRAIIESAVDAIVLINRRGTIEFFNPAAERIFGYPAHEVIGRNVSMLMPDPYASEHDHYLRRYQMTGDRRIIGIGREVTARRKDGTTFPGHLSVAELTVDGETKFTGIVRDLTERVSLEVRLREESGLVRIGELAAVLAHEVKNPLAAVSGAVQMLSEHLTAPEDQEIVQEILRRLDGLSALMTDLLLYSRPPRPQPRLIDVSELVRALGGFYKADPAWAKITVDVQGTTHELSADPELLKVVFQNLLLNAAQAMHFDGSIRVDLHRSGSRAFIDVRDAGPGIPPDVRSKLFTPFFTTKARGTGLGLATVRRIVESHGGQVEVLRSGHEGTTMRVSLPESVGR